MPRFPPAANPIPLKWFFLVPEACAQRAVFPVHCYDLSIWITVGIFGLFSKRESTATPPAHERPRAAEPVTQQMPQSVQRQAAAATSMKIDAIEFEMSSEFVDAALPRTIKLRSGPPNSPPPPTSLRQTPARLSPGNAIMPPRGASAIGANTALLADSDSIARTLAMPVSETAPAIDEAAILFSLGELGTVEELLQGAIRDPALDGEGRIAWAMLLDLYQVMRQREQFDELSIAYAERFETSPPAWIDVATASRTKSGDLPTITFSGVLDSRILPQLEQLQALAGRKHTVRLEFTRVSEVDPVGCGVLLRVLERLHLAGHDLVLVGALELALMIKAILEVGRRDETAAPWLLQLEIYRLLNMEQAFEDSSIDYCITFEVSPPAFEAPSYKVTAVEHDVDDVAEAIEQFRLPVEILEHSAALINDVEAYVAQHNPALLDCSKLVRVDFNAASQLLAHLEPLARNGAVIKLREVNHLVAALFRVAGMQEIAHIEARKI